VLIIAHLLGPSKDMRILREASHISRDTIAGSRLTKTMTICTIILTPGKYALSLPSDAMKGAAIWPSTSQSCTENEIPVIW
jgi:hypothetical protein